MRTIDDLRRYLIDTFSQEEVFLFGSRARGDASSYSDIDVAIGGAAPLDERLTIARFVIEESNLPHHVDLVDLSKAPWLEETIRQEGIRWH